MYNELVLDKFIIFQVANHLLALSINSVLKVVDCSTTNSKRLSTMGLVQIGKHMIRILDLHQQFISDGLPQPENESFLVITRDSQGELCGIFVDEPPDLIELPLEVIRPLPRADSYGKPACDLVSRVAVVSHKEETKTIFLLDIGSGVC